VVNLAVAGHWVLVCWSLGRTEGEEAGAPLLSGDVLDEPWHARLPTLARADMMLSRLKCRALLAARPGAEHQVNGGPDNAPSSMIYLYTA
jgi:hypothetical protein